MPINGKEMLKRFLKHGWEIVRKNGSHVMEKKLLKRLKE